MEEDDVSMTDQGREQTWAHAATSRLTILVDNHWTSLDIVQWLALAHNCRHSYKAY